MQLRPLLSHSQATKSLVVQLAHVLSIPLPALTGFKKVLVTVLEDKYYAILHSRDKLFVNPTTTTQPDKTQLISGVSFLATSFSTLSRRFLDFWISAFLIQIFSNKLHYWVNTFIEDSFAIFI